MPLDSGTTEFEPGRPATPVMQSVSQVSTLQIGPSTIEAIVASTLAIFAARWSSLVLAFLIFGAVMAFVVFVPLLVISEIADAGGDTMAGILLLFWVPVVVLLSAFVSVGLARVAIAIARNSSPTPIAELIPPLSLVVRILVGVLLLAVVLAVLGAVVGGLFAALIAVAGNELIVTLLTVLGALAASITLLVVQWSIWSWLLIVSDGKGTAIGSLRSAYAVTTSNRLTSAYLILIAIVLTALGAAICNIGHLVTAPLTMLMFAVAYLRMTGQPIDDPNVQANNDGPLPPAQPMF